MFQTIRWAKNCTKKTLFLFLLLLYGCPGGVPASYTHPNLDLSFYESVAVLPFNNLTQDQFAGARVRELVVSELLLTNLFNVLEPGIVDRAYRKVGVRPGTPLTKEEIKKLGDELNVQALVTGTVEIYRELRMGRALVPEVSIELRLIDVDSALPAWSVSATEGGIGLGTQLLGVRPATLSEATRTVVRKAVDSLFF